jgi:hypothetical protein
VSGSPRRRWRRCSTGAAQDTPCPTPPLFHYPDHPDAAHDALCEGTTQRNGFYGDGIVDAERILIGR